MSKGVKLLTMSVTTPWAGLGSASLAAATPVSAIVVAPPAAMPSAT
jgi:hypothetical protein